MKIIAELWVQTAIKLNQVFLQSGKELPPPKPWALLCQCHTKGHCKFSCAADELENKQTSIAQGGKCCVNTVTWHGSQICTNIFSGSALNRAMNNSGWPQSGNLFPSLWKYWWPTAQKGEQIAFTVKQKYCYGSYVHFLPAICFGKDEQLLDDQHVLVQYIYLWSFIYTWGQNRAHYRDF